nr:MAG TPA: hypothetical protein [Caudoviricetes sp.]
MRNSLGNIGKRVTIEFIGETRKNNKTLPNIK